MAAYLTELSGTHLAALLLSTGTPPDPRVSELTRATAAAGLPRSGRSEPAAGAILIGGGFAGSAAADTTVPAPMSAVARKTIRRRIMTWTASGGEGFQR